MNITIATPITQLRCVVERKILSRKLNRRGCLEELDVDGKIIITTSIFNPLKPKIKSRLNSGNAY
jgi:hypothetical protein